MNPHENLRHKLLHAEHMTEEELTALLNHYLDPKVFKCPKRHAKALDELLTDIEFTELCNKEDEKRQEGDGK